MSSKQQLSKSYSLYTVISIIIVVVILDALTKYFAATSLNLYESHNFIPFINFTMVHNFGVVFGMFNQAQVYQKWILIFLNSAIIFGLCIWLYKMRKSMSNLLAISFIVGGAVGNLVNRIVCGYVIDFIDISYKNYHWYVFNVADAFISIGVVIYLLSSFISSHDNNRN